MSQKYFTAKSITKTATACHDTRITIGCPSSLVIKITSAIWGRREKDKCLYTRVNTCGDEDISTTTKNLQKKCDHFESCNFYASEAETYLNNNCSIFHNYLEVNYTCIKGNLICVITF